MLNTKIIHKGNFSSRIIQIEINKKKIITPVFFPSISSATNRLQLTSLIQICAENKYPRLLVSAYDLYDERNGIKSTYNILKQFQKSNILFLDSGTFEKYWLNNNEWNFTKYTEVIKKFKCDFFASFDPFPLLKQDEKDISKVSQEFNMKSSTLQHNNQCVRIAHGNTSKQLCSVVSNLIKHNKCPILAISERECGATLLDQIQTIQKIRKLVDAVDDSILIHILGCSSPISIALFSLAGADMFDSTSWSRYIIDPKSLKYLDIHHMGILSCKCDICRSYKSNTIQQSLMHNLLFYQTFLLELRNVIISNNIEDFLSKYLEQKTLSKIVSFF